MLPAVWVNAPQVSNVTGASPYGVAMVDNTAYVANQGTNTVSVINTLTGQAIVRRSWWVAPRPGWWPARMGRMCMWPTVLRGRCR